VKYSVSLCQVETQYIAAVQAMVSQPQLGAKIREILCKSAVYEFLKTSGVQKAGHNIMVYHHENLGPSHEFLLEVGVQVAGPFEGNGQVVCSSTPAGTAVTTLYTGSYHLIGQAHNAVQNWAKEQHQPLTGLSWEVYGDWHEDPNQLTTDIFYLVP
jgi:effector-binding domain-containing protein